MTYLDMEYKFVTHSHYFRDKSDFVRLPCSEKVYNKVAVKKILYLYIVLIVIILLLLIRRF
jgi:hypothetical protein